jgi:formylglycine-generating enzyme required for sulfatase activity
LRGCDKIQDLSPVSGLKQLEKLDLGYCVGIEDFTPLQSLPNLKSLDLQGVKIPEGFQLPKSLPSIPTPGLDFLETVEGMFMKMVWIEGGEFMMGSDEDKENVWVKESPIHSVELDGFWIASTPVTQSQYKAIMVGKNPSHFKGDDLPVECVSWHDSNEFCKKLSGKTVREYSLPTEAQWEFACRAGSKGSFCFGDSDQRLEHFAWFEKNSENKTHPVGQKRPNAWGLFDMHGNVWEWCADWYGEYEKGKCINPKGPEEGESKMLRGGSWSDRTVYCRSACRSCSHPDSRNSYLGFRVVFVARTQKK